MYTAVFKWGADIGTEACTVYTAVFKWGADIGSNVTRINLVRINMEFSFF